MRRIDAARVLKRCLRKAGIVGNYSPHAFRAPGLSRFLEEGGSLGGLKISPITRTAAQPSCMIGVSKPCSGKMWKGFGTEKHKVLRMSTPTEHQEVKTPKVFVSYAQSVDRTDWIRQICERLIHDGVEVVVDLYELPHGADIRAFMERVISLVNLFIKSRFSVSRPPMSQRRKPLAAGGK